ncbi:MAG: hypothetical protein IPF99_03305 [Deltaproteobacteria bacterium]|nr:hypothetical protein [Deltaproteobacteria bacterium]
MQGHRFIAAVFLLTLAALGAVLPLGAPGLAVLGALALAVLVYAVLGERNLAAVGSVSQRATLAGTIARRALAATDEQRAGIASMEEDTRDAVQRLTGASAGQSARHALDALPWVLVLGLPQSGKSSMLASSGQAFAYATPSGGARGARNCRWWITQQCAWIDTGGSYILGESALPEWLTLLRNLATLRPAQPLHAVVITMAADSIPTARPEDVDAAAKRVRERLDEALGYLGIDVPVYLMVTRADRCRASMTSSPTCARPSGADLGQHLEGRRPRAHHRTRHPRLRRAAPHPGAPIAAAHGRSRAGGRAGHQLPVPAVVRGAPTQPRALRRDALRVQHLPRARERARGLFLQRRGVDGPHRRRPRADRARGHFLRDWISHVVVPDHELAGPSATEVHRRKGRRNAVAALLLSAAVLVASLGTWAWNENHDALQRFDRSFTASVNGRAPVALATLDPLRADVERLLALARDDAPPSTRFGMGVADQVAPRASLAFAKLVARDVVAPVVARLQRELVALRDRYAGSAAAPSPADRVRAQEKLRLYRLLTAPRVADDPQPADPAQLDWLTASRRCARGSCGCTERCSRSTRASG